MPPQAAPKVFQPFERKFMNNSTTPWSSNTRAVRAVIWGVGELGKLMGGYLLERGVILVGAVDASSALIGKDLGLVLGHDAPMGVTIMAPNDPAFPELKADIACFAAHNDLVPSMVEGYETCIRAGMNIVDVGGEISWAWATNPQLAARLDKLARECGVTVTGSGNQEMTMGGGTFIGSECHTLTEIWHKTRCDIELYGKAVLDYCCVGESIEGFKKVNTPFRAVDTFMCNQAADLGLTIKTIERETRPLTPETPHWSKVLGRNIEPGEVLGTYRIVRITTYEGIDLIGEEEVSVLRGGEDNCEYKEWVVKGEPPIRLRCDYISKGSVPAAAVNRIPDILAAAPGYRTIDTFGRNRYRAHPYVLPADQ
jgi:4-hydroxy-tetrahydrodipicolinate reductase